MKDIFPLQYSPVHQHVIALSAFSVNTVGFSKKLGWVTWKGIAKKKEKKKILNKRVNEETDSRRVEEEENNLGRNIKRE